jgi:predicted LPLAT superfamily acyltransferase
VGLIDRTAILAGDVRHFSFTFEGEQYLREAVTAGKGVLLLTAHVGNWEVAGQLLARLDVPVNVTGFDSETPEVRALLNQIQARQKFRLIPLTGSPADMVTLVAALRRGEIVAMLGDRTYGGPVAEVPFLGDLAPFPVGVYMLATAADAPLVHVFSLRERGGRYHFFGFPPTPPHRPPRDQRDAHLRACAAAFAANLEDIVRRNPLQWYNFYPFWNKISASTNASAISEPSPPAIVHHAARFTSRP